MNIIGDVSFLLSALGLSVNAFIIKHKLEKVPNIIIAICNITMVTCGFFIFGLIFEQLNSFSLILLRKDLLIAIILAGVSVTIIFLLYYYCLEKLEVWVVRTFLLS
ncbi:MAG TPA: hypothetical protein ENH82_10100, partial [bacterium]|nr:hypothetical protein [bacterium]